MPENSWVTFRQDYTLEVKISSSPGKSSQKEEPQKSQPRQLPAVLQHYPRNIHFSEEIFQQKVFSPPG